MKLPLLSLCCALLLLVSCQSPEISPIGRAGDYFPATELLRKGVVNKYYFHFTSADGYEKSTDISYYCYRLLPDDRLEITVYDAGFQPSFRNVTRFEGDRQIVETQERYWRNDTLPVELLADVAHDWAGTTDTARLETLTDYGAGTELLSLRQTSRAKAAYQTETALVFETARESLFTLPDEAPHRDSAVIRDVYRLGIGLFTRVVETAKGEGRMELVQQIPRREFMKRKAAAPQRVAYINPNNTLDAAGDFTVCHPNAFIYDYYNSSPPAQYRGGKRALETVFAQALRPELTKDAAGYLTFRFVINCAGEAGRFITEEADLDFKRTEFPNALVRHTYDILRELDDWQAAVYNEEPVDAYAYITLKFRAGELIEILP